MRRLLAGLLVLTLVAAACGDDATDGAADDDTVTDDTDGSAGNTDDTADDTDGSAGNGGDDDDDTTTTTTEPVELFDSFQGVTATEIEFGIAAIDAESLLAFGFDLGAAPVEDMYDAWTTAQNERGGVLGRNLVPHTELFLPIGSVPSEEVCLKFSQDIGVFAVIEHRRAILIAIALAVPVAVMHLWSFTPGLPQFPQLRLALYITFLTFMTVNILRDVLRSEAVTWDKIQGAVCAYLLIGVTWGAIYAWIGLRDPQAFSGALQGFTADPTASMTYFSFVTLTTLGYGDITPLTPSARSLATLEAIIGQFYVAVIVARLVGIQVAQSFDKH